MDNYSSKFSIIHLLNDESKSYYNHLNINNYKYSLKDMMNVAYKKYNKNDLFRIMCWGVVPYLQQSIHNLKIQYLDCIQLYLDPIEHVVQKELVNGL